MELIQLDLDGSRDILPEEKKEEHQVRTSIQGRLEIFLHREKEDEKSLCFRIISSHQNIQLDTDIEGLAELREFRDFINRKLDELIGKDPVDIRRVIPEVRKDQIHTTE